MRLAVISDIHGNAYALDIALADLEQHPADAIVCLGDAIQGGPQPHETVLRLRQLAISIVMGNADAWLLTGKETGAENPSPERQKELNAVREWSLAQLTADDREFISAFQPTITIPLAEKLKLLCYHGSPKSFDDVLLPDSPYETFIELLGGDPQTWYCGGHTHVQFLRRVGETFHFNPGSIGNAYSHHQPDDDFHTDAVAEYAVFTVEGGRTGLEFRRVPYDASAIISIYRASGRPYTDKAIKQYTR